MLSISEPLCTNREFSNNVGSKPHFCQRAGLAILPILSMHQGLSFPISLGMGGLRTWTTLNELLAACQSGTSADISYQALQSAIAVAALAGTLFKHPVGMLISTGHDLLIEIQHLIGHLNKGDRQKILESCASLINNALYLALFFHGTLELSIASLALQMMSDLYQLVVDGSQKNYLEAAGHLIMLAVHRTQLKDLAKTLKMQYARQELERVGILNCGGTTAETDSITTVNRTISLLDKEIQNKAINNQEDKRLITIAKKLNEKLRLFIPRLTSFPVPGCCNYEGQDYLVNVVAIAEKQERVEKALAHLKINPVADTKVHDYFQRTLAKLKQGLNIPLPDFFHATRAGLESIIKDQTIRQSPSGAAGPGTYISSNNEGEHGYGSHAFAIDEGCVTGTSGKFFTGRRPQGNIFFSLWSAVLKDIPITDKTVAFVDTSQQDEALVKGLLQAQNLNIEVVNRATSEAIHTIFDLSTKRRELPSFFWSKRTSDDFLPTNMFSRSELGTFRDFMWNG